MDWESLLQQSAPALAQAGGTIAGQAAATGQNAQALAAYQALAAKYGNVPLPGQTQAAPVNYGDTALANIQEDPAALAGYTQADQSLGNIINGGGMTLADKANMAATYQKLAQQNSQTQGNIRNDLNARGALSSGAGLAMQLQAQQQGSQQAANAAQQTDASAQARAMQAIQQRASQASQRSNQEYSRAAQTAEARDAISQHNANAQNVANQYNNGLAQQQFGNQITRIGGPDGKAGIAAAQGQAGVYGNQAKQDQGFYGAMGTGAAGIATQINKQNAQNSGGSGGGSTGSTGSGYGSFGVGIDGGAPDEEGTGWVG